LPAWLERVGRKLPGAADGDWWGRIDPAGVRGDQRLWVNA
jgi:hypothetical protein